MGRYAKPKWAWFLDGKKLEAMGHKALQSACKKARISANGSSAALRNALKEFVGRKEPPDWFVDGMQNGLSATAALKAASKVQLCFDRSISSISICVGQHLEHKGHSSKCHAASATLKSAQPENCIVEVHRRSQVGARSGFFGGGTTDTATFRALVPGVATVQLLERRGAAGSLQHEGRSVTVTIVDPT